MIRALLRAAARCLFVAGAFTGAAGCGQKGPLKLPEPKPAALAP